LNTFLKIGAGLVLSALGAFLFMQFGRTQQSADQSLIVYSALAGIGEVLVAPLLYSSLATYAHPRYLGTMFGGLSLCGWLLAYNVVYKAPGIGNEQWIWTGICGLAVMGIATIALIFILKASRRS
jgi:MFS family permease